MARTKFHKQGSMREIGSTGLRIYGGQISEEYMRQLAGSQGMRTYAEMRDNDPTIGAILFIIDKLLRNVKWKSIPADDSIAASTEAEFVEECMEDMEHSWEEFISEIMSMLTYGYSPHEIVYKLRGGADETDPSKYSKHKDNRIGWRKLPIRAQETIWEWVTNDSGDVVALKQLPVVGGQIVTIPIDKLLLFRTQSYKNNPQGRSILRNAFRPWFFKKRIEEIEGVGIERDLAGLPVAKVPANLLLSTASSEEKATLSAIKKLVMNIRRDEQEGIVFPLVYDESGKELYKLELLSTGGSRQFDTSAIVTRYSKAIAMSVAADFIFLGQDKVGSFALSSDKTSMFSLALGAWLKDIASVINKKAIPKLMKLNGIPPELWPKVQPGDIEKEDVMRFVDSVYKLVGVGAMIPDEDIDAKARELLELPVKVAGAYDAYQAQAQELAQQQDMSPDNKRKEKDNAQES